MCCNSAAYQHGYRAAESQKGDAGSAGAQIEPQEALLMLNNLPSSHIATVTLDGQWNYCQFGKY